ncbi:hypothetical protein Ancab_025075 [Ancistrocladus abbreviatus]
MGFLVTTLIFVVIGIIASLWTRICCNRGPSTNLIHRLLSMQLSTVRENQYKKNDNGRNTREGINREILMAMTSRRKAPPWEGAVAPAASERIWSIDLGFVDIICLLSNYFSEGFAWWSALSISHYAFWFLSLFSSLAKILMDNVL